MIAEELEFQPIISILVFIAATGGVITVIAFNYETGSSFDLTGFRHRLMAKNYIEFWKKLPGRFWRFFILAFLIPNYREEWGDFKNWNCRSKLRPPKDKQRIYHKKKKKHCRGPSVIENPKTVLEKRLELEVSHDHSQCKRIKINVNGQIFETQLRTLKRFPDTLLGNPNMRMQYYDSMKNEYYFDRNRHCFEWILYYYQSGGRLCRPEYIQNDVFYQEIRFFKLGKASIERYERDEGWTKREVLMDLPKYLYKRKIWLLFDVPESSRQATCVALISIFVVLISIITFCLETVDAFTPTKQDGPCVDIQDSFFALESVCSLWFLLEIIFRLYSCPNTVKFLKNFINIIDILAVLPYIISVGSYVWDPSSCSRHKKNSAATSSLAIIRVVRLVRVFRILKLSRHNKGLKILGLTLSSSLSELVLLIFFVGMGTILFASAMYYAEQSFGNNFGHGSFQSIPEGFWWALQTLTTVGYGDQVPRSFGGKLIGALCAIAGVLTLSLPVPVIVSNFNNFYRQEIDEMEQRPIPYKHVDMCPYLPAGYSSGVETNAIIKQTAESCAKCPTSDHMETIPQKPYEEPKSDSDFDELKYEIRSQKKVGWFR